MNYVSSGQKVPDAIGKKYNAKEIKDALKIECNSKCMYCESIVGHITYEHIEHIKPKAKYPRLTFEYSNLGLACPKCNMNKHDTYDITTPFINPYSDNPEDHFIAMGAFIWAKSGDANAKVTEIELDLNRPELLEIRGERMKVIKDLVDKYNTTSNSTLKSALRKEINREVEDCKPYSFCAKRLVEQLMI
jgi:hypothetical protein